MPVLAFIFFFFDGVGELWRSFLFAEREFLSPSFKSSSFLFFTVLLKDLNCWVLSFRGVAVLVLAIAARDSIISVWAAILTLFSLPVSLAGLQAGKSGVAGGTIILGVVLSSLKRRQVGVRTLSVVSSVCLSPTPDGVRGTGNSPFSTVLLVGLFHCMSCNISTHCLVNGLDRQRPWLETLAGSRFGSFEDKETGTEDLLFPFDSDPCFLFSSCTEVTVFSLHKLMLCWPFESLAVSWFFCFSSVSRRNSFSLFAVVLWKGSNGSPAVATFRSGCGSFADALLLLPTSGLHRIRGNVLSFSLFATCALAEDDAESTASKVFSFLSFWDKPLVVWIWVFPPGAGRTLSKQSTLLWLSLCLEFELVLSTGATGKFSSTFLPSSAVISLSEFPVLKMRWKLFSNILVLTRQVHLSWLEVPTCPSKHLFKALSTLSTCQDQE